MERERFICCLIGKYSALYPNDSADDLRTRVDQHLIECNFTGIGNEEGDVALMQDLLDETIWSVLGQGVNRKMRREQKRRQ